MMTPKPRRGWALAPVTLVFGLVTFACVVSLAGPYIHPISSHDASVAVAMRNLLFVDRDDGGVGILDADNGSTVAVIPAGQENFVRATMRGLARQRYREGVSAQVPFRLTAWKDDRLSLVDLGTGRTLELESFGPTNEANFARLLPLPGVSK
jgi:putative photosynthetic complex assembly protein